MLTLIAKKCTNIPRPKVEEADMSRTGRLLFVGLFLVATVAGVCAQTADWDKKNELAVLFERDIARGHAIKSPSLPPPFTDNRVNIGNGYAIQGNYGRRLHVSDLVGYTFEVPVVYLPDMDLLSSNDLVPEGYSAFFVTPGVRANLFPNTLVSPWASVGGGFARFSTSKNGVFNVLKLPGKSSTASVIEFGLGLDVKVWHSFRFRAEARDFYSGVPQFSGIDQGRTRMHNVTGGGGLSWVF